MNAEAVFALMDKKKANRGEGAPVVTDSTTTAATLEMEPNKLYIYSGGLTALTITFAEGGEGAAEYRICFKSAASAPTVSLPNTVVFSPATPIYEADKWYEFSFIPLGNKYMGVFTYTQA